MQRKKDSGIWNRPVLHLFAIGLLRILCLKAKSKLVVASIYGSESPPTVRNSVKIVGGTETTIQKHPYQVHLLFTQEGTGEKIQCSGSIVKSRCVVTAAHCMIGKESVLVRAGSTNSESGGSTYNSRTLIMHPEYNRRKKDYDLGIIKLTTPIELDGQNTTAIQFPTSNCTVTPGTNLTVSGWGDVEKGGSSSTTLREVSVEAEDFDECKTKYKRLTPRMICAGVPEGGKDACQGDSGGPLVRTGTKNQVGIVSYGRGCARPGYPGVYTNLCNREIQNWLKEMNCA